MDHFYKVYPKFKNFAILLSQIDFENCEFYSSDRTEIYDRLRLPMRIPSGDVKEYVDSLIEEFFGINNYTFSIIPSTENSQIHSDVYFKKQKELNRFCNFAFPLKGDFTNRQTYWPELSKKDTITVIKNSYLNDEQALEYLDENKWKCSVKHTLYNPVLLNTEIPHGTIGTGYSLFAYITIPGKTYEDCVALYNEISNSATI